MSPYISNTKKEQQEMLETIGVHCFEELIKQVPEKYLNSELKIFEKSLSEIEVYRKMKRLASKNKKVLNFLGAGAYEHYIPPVIKTIISRGEFLTAYTPYQAEASQGILQSIYEYQSLICSLFEMDCTNASLYDGASALGEAARACIRINSRKKIIYPASLNPEYEAVLKTYFANDEKNYEFVPAPLSDGKIDLNVIEKLIDENTSCVIIQNPNFFGIYEEMPEISEMAHKKGALFIAIVNPISLGIIIPPGQYNADFAVAEGQPLGIPLNYGGPYLGIFTCKKEYIRQMPGRIAGITKDKEGKRGFVLTLQAREQHIRRDRAVSNICSNEALCALSAAVYLTILGPEGIKELAQINTSASQHAFEKLISIDGVKPKFSSPFFNEFVLSFPKDVKNLRTKILNEDFIDIGLPLKRYFPDMGNCLLVCVTETKTEEDIDRLVQTIRKNL